MRVRPFFWFLLALVCIATLLFAVAYQTHTPDILRLRILQQQLTATQPATIRLALTDEQGLPIENARIHSHASMTNMDMPTKEIKIEALGHGDYLIHLHLFMAGPWAITVQAVVDGFAPSQQNLYVQVE